ncbi:hypothetical protein THAPSDRAFT_260982, partial [Thalassiosira pseudonana CCMP1335]
EAIAQYNLHDTRVDNRNLTSNIISLTVRSHLDISHKRLKRLSVCILVVHPQYHSLN